MGKRMCASHNGQVCSCGGKLYFAPMVLSLAGNNCGGWEGVAHRDEWEIEVDWIMESIYIRETLD